MPAADVVIDAGTLLGHVGHRVEIATYAADNVAVECVDCHEVLGDTTIVH